MASEQRTTRIMGLADQLGIPVALSGVWNVSPSDGADAFEMTFSVEVGEGDEVIPGGDPLDAVENRLLWALHDRDDKRVREKFKSCETDMEGYYREVKRLQEELERLREKVKRLEGEAADDAAARYAAGGVRRTAQAVHPFDGGKEKP